ncbi:MAG: peroxidase family protein, partial [Beijerinckiaceae bacterium]
MSQHGIPNRHPTPLSLKSVANKDPGLFGKMFPGLPAHVATDAALLELAKAMRDPEPAEEPQPGGQPTPRDNPAIPAGFTYLGQFIDHDITLDLTSLGEQIHDPEAKENFRSPSLDLDSVYLLGPGGSPQLYERDPATLKTGPKLLIGTAAQSGIPPFIGGGGTVPNMPAHDLPRTPLTGVAMIGDPRNDENLLVAQTHVAFMRVHNKMVDHLKAKGVPAGQLFDEARKLTTGHSQWIVLHEFLEKLTGEAGIAARIMKQGRKF